MPSRHCNASRSRTLLSKQQAVSGADRARPVRNWSRGNCRRSASPRRPDQGLTSTNALLALPVNSPESWARPGCEPVPAGYARRYGHHRPHRHIHTGATSPSPRLLRVRRRMQPPPHHRCPRSSPAATTHGLRRQHVAANSTACSDLSGGWKPSGAAGRGTRRWVTSAAMCSPGVAVCCDSAALIARPAMTAGLRPCWIFSQEISRDKPTSRRAAGARKLASSVSAPLTLLKSNARSKVEKGRSPCVKDSMVRRRSGAHAPSGASAAEVCCAERCRVPSESGHGLH